MTPRSRVEQIDKDIGVKLREFRLAAGFSQVQLGAAIGRSYVQIQKYESGANRIAVATLIHICRALELNPMDIIGEYVDVHEPTYSMSSQQAVEAAKEAERSPRKKPNDFFWNWRLKRKARPRRG